MKILVISSLYPPHYVGGYELGCADVVERLRARGHEVRILTSTYGVDQPVCEGHVYRWLRSDMGWDFTEAGAGWRLFRKEVVNRRALREVVQSFAPDLVYVWSLRYISASLAVLARRLGLPVCFYTSDEWLGRWDHYDRWAQTPRNGLRRGVKQALRFAADTIGGRIDSDALQLRHVQCTSAYIRQALISTGKPVSDARVTHWGVDTNRYQFDTTKRSPAERLLYVGQVVEHKGLHTAIEACRLLVQHYKHTNVTLTIVGGVVSSSYHTRVLAMVREYGLERHVTFAGLMPREQLPNVYQAHDILLFPSIWEEPFSITLLEALASGLAVVSTATGGTPELLYHNTNALLFSKEDAASCAAHVVQLHQDASCFERIRAAGRQTVEQGFRIEQMVDRIESHLRQVINNDSTI